MRKIAIVYATKKGQSEKIAAYLAEKAGAAGLGVELLPASAAGPLSPGVEGVIYGGPVYAGKYPKPLLRWVRKQRAQLEKIPTALFVVCLNAADQRPSARAADEGLLEVFVKESGHLPGFLATFAGALKYRDYWWPVRLMMKRIARQAGGDTDTSRNYEYTRWDEVDRFLRDFLEQRSDSPFALAQHPMSKKVSRSSASVSRVDGASR